MSGEHTPGSIWNNDKSDMLKSIVDAMVAYRESTGAYPEVVRVPRMVWSQELDKVLTDMGMVVDVLDPYPPVSEPSNDGEKAPQTTGG